MIKLTEYTAVTCTYGSRKPTVIQAIGNLYGLPPSGQNFSKAVVVPGPGSRSYRVPTLPDPTGYYYCTLQ